MAWDKLLAKDSTFMFELGPEFNAANLKVSVVTI